jgi:hypothetical protein
MPRAKKRHIATSEELPSLFDDKFVREQRLSLRTDIPALVNAILETAGRYLAEMAVPDERVMRAEIFGLYSAADRRRYRETARRVSGLSSQTRAFLNKRGARRRVGLVIPDADAFDDPARRDEACETVARLLRVGMKGGKPILHAPKPQPRPSRRKAELNLVMWLEEAYYRATGKPTITANPGLKPPGPFTRLAQAVLDRVAGPGVSAVDMINELQRRRKLKRKSGTVPKT